MSGVTPVRPPQPSSSFGAVDQLTTPITSGPSPSKAGAPESPVQAPRPARLLRVAGSYRRTCSVPGLPVTASCRHARHAEAAAVPALRDAEAGDGERLADGDAARGGERRRHDDIGQRRRELDQRDIGGGAAGGVARHVEARMTRDASAPRWSRRSDRS